MTAPPRPPEAYVAEVFPRLAAELTAAHADVQPSRMFGSRGLKIHGKTFAMVVKDHLVVKLPRERVNQLVDTGAGQRFDPGHGHQMREWVTPASTDPTTCRTLMAEALSFVSSITL